MGWIPLRNVIEKSHLTERTIFRRLAKLKEIDPVLYVKIYRRQKGPGHVRYEVLEKEFTAFLNTDIRVFKRANIKEIEKKDGKPIDAPEPSTMRMLVELLRVNDIHEIDPDVKEQVKEMMYSNNSARFQRCIKICFHYSHPEESQASACSKINMSVKTFRIIRRNLPLVNLLFENAKVIRSQYRDEIDKEDTIHSLNKLIKGYDKVFSLKKYKIKTLPNGKEAYIPYEMHEKARHVPPSIQAIAIQLFNKLPDEYKRFTPFEAGQPIGKVSDDIDNMTEEEVMAELKQLEATYGNNADRKSGEEEA